MAKDVPVLVKIIAVLGYILAALFLIGGIGMIIGAGAIAGILASVFPLGAGIGAGLFIVLGIVFIALAVLYFFVSRGLWKGQNWARIVLIVLCAIGVITSIMPLNILGLIINLAIGLYMLLASDVKAAFK